MLSELKSKKPKFIYYYLNFYATVRFAVVLFLLYVLTMIIIGTMPKQYDLGNYHIDINKAFYPFLNEKNYQELRSDTVQHITFEVKDEGEVLYEPIGNGYRYGPSLLMNEDGTIHAYFASNANNSEWDWITYRYFDGESWSNEKIVLQPTGNSLDHYSTCDPGVFYYDGYYYLGYTSTTNDTDGGIDNDIYVARSTSPTGPFEKWNGEDWGGDPYPIIDYDGDPSYWGAGEISFVIYENELYCYYSYISNEGGVTRLAIADLCEDWPSTLKQECDVIQRGYGQDSFDFAYLEKEEMFVALATYNRFHNDSGIVVYQSKDGRNFYIADYFAEDVAMYCHNLGISKRGDGHILEEDTIYLGYGYAQSANAWGKWALRIQELEMKIDKGKINTYKESPTLYSFTNATNNKTIIGINVEPRTISLSIGKGKYLSLYAYNGNLKRSTYNKKVNYEYDKNIISINKNGYIKAISSGECNVLIYNDDFYTTLKVIVK